MFKLKIGGDRKQILPNIKLFGCDIISYDLNRNIIENMYEDRYPNMFVKDIDSIWYIQSIYLWDVKNPGRMFSQVEIESVEECFNQLVAHAWGSRQNPFRICDDNQYGYPIRHKTNGKVVTFKFTNLKL